MQSRTSFFNGHVLKKDITRFAPLWAVYTVFLAVYMFGNISYMMKQETVKMAYSFSQDLGYLCLLFLFYGFGCATFLFGDLFRTRMAGGLHAMPLRRETWFGTHVTAGILFAAVPNTLIAAAMAVCLGEYAFVAGLWWLVVTGQFLFHFALGVLCVMLAGNLLGHAAVFGTIEFLSLLIYGVFDTVYEPMLYGISVKSEWFEFFSPGQWWNFQDWLQWNIQDNIVVAEGYGKFAYDSYTAFEPSYIYEGLIVEEWIYLGVTTLLAVACIVLALVLYRRRKLECAGDFIVSKPVRWVFLILGSMYAAIVVPVAGFVIGFFGILMLSERTVKVFRKKNLIAFAITAGAVLLTLGLTALDIAGITTKVPQQTDIAFVTLNPDWGNNTTVLTEAEDIRAVMDAHEHALVDRDPEEGDWYTLNLEYTLKNGSTMRRYYYLKADVPAMKGIERILSTWENVFDGADPESVRDSLERVTLWQEVYDENGMYISANEVAIPEEAIGELLEAIRQDCQEGTMAQNMAFHEEEYASLTFWYADSFDGRYFRNSLTVFGDSAHTVAALEQYLQ